MALKPPEISPVTVSELQQLEFSQLPLDEKIAVLKRSRPTPNIQIYQTGVSNNKKYIRSFNTQWYRRKSWLCGCEIKNALFCFPCLLYGGDVTWTKDGYRNINKLKEKTEKHEKSSKHVYNENSLSLFGITKPSVNNKKIKEENPNSDDSEAPVLHNTSIGQEDEYDSHGKTIAAKLRRIAALNYDQFLLADKLLNEVLFRALRQQLTGDSTITETNPPTPYCQRWNVQPQSYGSSTPSNSSIRSPTSSVTTGTTAYPTVDQNIRNQDPLEHGTSNILLYQEPVDTDEQPALKKQRSEGSHFLPETDVREEIILIKEEPVEVDTDQVEGSNF